MKLSNYSPVFQLIAGLSAAATGLETYTTLFTSRLFNRFESFVLRLNNTLIASQSNLAQMNALLKNSRALNVDPKFNSLYDRIKRVEEWSNRVLPILSTDREKGILRAWVETLFLSVFLYCLTILLSAAFVDDDLCKHLAVFKFLGDLSVLIIGAMLFILIGIRHDDANRLGTTFTVFVVITGLSLAYAKRTSDSFIIVVSDICIICSAVMICLLPIVLILGRLFWWRRIRLGLIERKIQDAENLNGHAAQELRNYAYGAVNLPAQT